MPFSFVRPVSNNDNVGSSVRRFVGSSVRRFVGSSVRWLVCWFVGLFRWFVGPFNCTFFLRDIQVPLNDGLVLHS